MINNALTIKTKYKEMCELLTSGCRYKETANMFIKLLDHFYNVERGHIAT